MEAQELNNILVVDDTPVNLHLLTDILKNYNYKVNYFRYKYARFRWLSSLQTTKK